MRYVVRVAICISCFVLGGCSDGTDEEPSPEEEIPAITLVKGADSVQTARAKLDEVCGGELDTRVEITLVNEDGSTTSVATCEEWYQAVAARFAGT